MNHRPKRPIDRRLLAALAEHPVMASLVGAEMADRFTATSTPLGILASVPLGDLAGGGGGGRGPRPRGVVVSG
ncbi:hypothetical protein [Streptosporangium sandarakinum]|uniref:hypothetical protein n=1 Tax=Streptosporangium sandarakinum TaxID=1260955 RepID=UPI0033A2A851